LTEVPAYVNELRHAVWETSLSLEKLSDSIVSRRPAPGKWSIKEIIGHLVDSASNNHQRFVRAPQQDHLTFVGYEQDEWVRAQDYAAAPWQELVTLWRTFNLHLARVMERTPEDMRTKRHRKHNLDQVAFRPVSASDEVTLDWFMEDYVLHLKHHLRQIDSIRS
jgi:hypothetical protein